MDRAYKSLKMSEQKKREMIQAVKHGTVRKQRSYVGIVAPMFVMLALLLFVITGQGNTTSNITSGSSINTEEITQAVNFKDLLILWTVSLVFLMIAYVQFLILARRPTRLLNYRLFRWANAAFHTWKLALIGSVPFLWMAIETLVLAFFPYELVAQFFVVVLLLINVFLVQLKIVKDRQRSTCPHCGVELTTKEIFMNKKCGVCGNSRFRKVQNSIQEFIATTGALIIMFFPFFQISLIYIILYTIAYIFFTIKYILPYLYTYQKEDEIPPPLW